VIGIGIDTVEVERFRRALQTRPAIAERLFTPAEQAYCQRQRDPAERFAARFAAKEAVMKALGVGLGAFAFGDVEVVKASSGAPSLSLTGRAANLAARRGVTAWHVSLTHTGLVAEAIAVAL
jgi:holo-[acyl-carrier protein] synthase